jgi:hypothetical protein
LLRFVVQVIRQKEIKARRKGFQERKNIKGIQGKESLMKKVVMKIMERNALCSIEV